MPHDPATRRTELYDLLGDLPPRDRPITAETTSTEDRPTFRLERLTLDLNGLEPVPALFLTPLDAKPKRPVIIYNHAHFGDYVTGKEELLTGRTAMQSPPYADVLTGLGYCVLCIDHWAFGERAKLKESETFKHMLWHGRVMWGMMVYDTLRALDYAATRPEVDPGRVATIGMSMGSTMAWWFAALDTRVRVCVDICCQTDYQALIEDRGLDRHGIYYYVPSLLKHFDATGINALIAPRPHLAVAGLQDRLTPPAGLQKIDEALKQIYQEHDAREAWELHTEDVAHVETPAMREKIVKFLQRWL